jgi:hypothetical protein
LFCGIRCSRKPAEQQSHRLCSNLVLAFPKGEQRNCKKLSPGFDPAKCSVEITCTKVSANSFLNSHNCALLKKKLS